jgi:hypothetical protein
VTAAKRPVSVILLQILLIIAAGVLALVAVRLNLRSQHPEALFDPTIPLLLMLASILLLVLTFLGLLRRWPVSRWLAMVSLGALGYFFASFGSADRRIDGLSDELAVRSSPLSAQAVIVLFIFAVWIWAACFSPSALRFYQDDQESAGR